jgi:hypothetical protein
VPLEEPVVATEPVHRLRSIPPLTIDDRTSVRRLEFVPVGEDANSTPRRRATRDSKAPQPAAAAAPAPAPTSAEPRWSLWGDLEP